MSSAGAFIDCGDVHLPKSQYKATNNHTNDDSIKRISIVHISDTHQKHAQLNIPYGDILIHTGDFLHKCSEMNDAAIEQINNFNNWLGEQPHPIKIIICGNHEGIFTDLDSSQILKSINNATHYLQDSLLNINGINFYGTPWSIISSRNTAFGFDKNDENKLNEKYDLIPSNTDILLHHLPPHNIHDLAWRHWYNFNEKCKFCYKIHTKFDHWGSTHLLHLIQNKIKPIACLFGHVHDSPGHSIIDNILFCNSAMALNSNCHKFNVVFDLDDKVMAIDDENKTMEQNQSDNYKVKQLMDKVMKFENVLNEKDNKYKLQQNIIQTLTAEKETLINDLHVVKEKNNGLNLKINNLENDNILYEKDLKEFKQKYNNLENDNILYEKDLKELKQKYDNDIGKLEHIIQSNQQLRAELNQLQKANNELKSQQKKNIKKPKRSYGCTSFLKF